MKRIFLIVLDSFGVGQLPDAEKFGDFHVNTLRACASSKKLQIPNMISAGLANIDGVTCLKQPEAVTGAYGKCREASMGKDTTIGHWEISGIISPEPLPTYPEGFPDEILEAFEKATGRGILCNKPYSGTEVIKDYGQQQRETGKWIVYTSADSVFQVAANEEFIPLEELYDACHKAREILKGKHGVGRVIARPYVGNEETGYTRTPNRHDYSHSMPALEDLSCFVAGIVKLLQGNELLVGGNLEHGVCRGVDNPLSGFSLLLTVVLDDLGAGIGLVAENAPAGGFFEGIQHLLGEALGIGGQRLRRDDTGDLPVADGGILAHGGLPAFAVGSGDRLGPFKAGDSVDISKACRDHVGDVQLFGGGTGGQSVDVEITELFGIGQLAHAEGVQYDEKYTLHKCFLLRNWEK